MAVSIQDIIVKLHSQKWDNYPKLKQAITEALASKNNWAEVELNSPWYWSNNILTERISVHYRGITEKRKTRFLTVDIR